MLQIRRSIFPTSILRLVLFGLVANSWSTTAWARPATTKLLPKSTQAYISIPDVAELKLRAQDTSTARMLRDKQVEPLVRDLYGTAMESLAKFEEQLGMPLVKLLEIPQGELSVAFVAVKEGRPALVVLMDVGSDNKPFDTFLEAGLAKAAEAGIEPREEKFGETAVSVLDLSGEDGNQVLYCRREETFVVTTDAKVMAGLLEAWDGGKNEPLSSDEAFSEIRERARGAADEAPQVMYFFDPIGIVEAIGEDNTAVRLAESFLAPLGLDGLRGLGGAITLNTGQFESIHRATILIDAPRRGVMELIAVKAGDTVPENWVPADAASYVTFNWDFLEMYDDLRHLVDSFRGEGSFSDRVNTPFKNETGIDLEQEILPYLEGRVSIVSSMTRPVTLTSQTAVYGFKLKDPDKLRPVLDKLGEKYTEAFTKETYGAMSYYKFSPPGLDERPDAANMPRPCVGILGEYLLIANQQAGLEQVVLASEDPTRSLASTEDFQTITEVIKQLPGGEAPIGITFARPEESLRFLYELANSEQTRKQLAKQGEENEFFGKVGDVLDRNPLPPFEVIAKYFSPSGAMMVEEETGWQYIDFSLRKEESEE
jgi:hypothetical protein